MEVAEPEKRSQLLKIHFPILINFLKDEKLGVNTNQFERKVDNFISSLVSLVSLLLLKLAQNGLSDAFSYNKSNMMQKGL